MSLGRLDLCAQSSLLRSESLAGTAVPVRCFLLVEHNGFWPRETQSILDMPELDSKLRIALKEFSSWCPVDVRVLLVRKAKNNPTRRITIVRSEYGASGGQIFTFSDRTNQPIFSDMRRAFELPGRIPELLLICTHGRKDKCCAKFGAPVFRFLSENASSSADVWQCSHVGGDRFAANVLWLPSGLMFGHVQSQTDAFLHAIQRRRVSLVHLRGRGSLPNPAQYLEIACRQSWSLEEYCEVQVLQYSEHSIGTGTGVACLAMEFVLNTGRVHVEANVEVTIPLNAPRVLMSCGSGSYGVPKRYRILSLSVSGSPEFQIGSLNS